MSHEDGARLENSIYLNERLIWNVNRIVAASIVADGVVLIDPDYAKDRKVFGHVLAAFKYGREDLDVLGLTFRKDLYLAAEQIYPAVPGAQQRKLTRLQEKLIKKLGSNAYPFYFELPPHCPASVTLQPAPGDTGKPCGVDYELKAFVGETQDDKPQKRYEPRLSRSPGRGETFRDHAIHPLSTHETSIFPRNRPRAPFLPPFSTVPRKIYLLLSKRGHGI